MVSATYTRTKVLLAILIATVAVVFFSFSNYARAEDGVAPMGMGAENGSSTSGLKRPPLPPPPRPTLNAIGQKLEDRNKPGGMMGSSTMRERMEDMHGSSTASSTRPRMMLPPGIKIAVENNFKTAVGRLNAAIDRLKNISGRIGSRIVKLNADGIDVTNATTLLTTANGKITDAQAKIALIVKPTPPTNTTDPSARDAYKAAFEAMRGEVKVADQAIRDAQKALEAVLKEIRTKGGTKADDEGHGPQASTTPPTI